MVHQARHQRVHAVRAGRRRHVELDDPAGGAAQRRGERGERGREGGRGRGGTRLGEVGGVRRGRVGARVLGGVEGRAQVAGVLARTLLLLRCGIRRVRRRRQRGRNLRRWRRRRPLEVGQLVGRKRRSVGGRKRRSVGDRRGGATWRGDVDWHDRRRRRQRNRLPPAGSVQRRDVGRLLPRQPNTPTRGLNQDGGIFIYLPVIVFWNIRLKQK